jgi:protein-tyrosine kinase
MSNIFKAISRGSGEISEAIMAAFSEKERDAGEAATPEGACEQRPPREEPVPLRGALPHARTLPARLSGKSPLLPFDDTDFAAAEQYRIIRTKLIQHPRRPQFLVITSTGPGDGKSVTAVNLAGALSLKLEARVLLADMDLRRSALHTRLGLPASPGLGEVLNGTPLGQAVVRIEQLPNLYFISAGELAANPSELLDSDRWAALCKRLRADFRYIVADSPPIGSVADYDLLQASCDGVVLVARPDHTLRQAFLRALTLIPKEKLTGVVMNCISDWFLTRRSHYNSYSAYYGRKHPDAIRRAAAKS